MSLPESEWSRGVEGHGHGTTWQQSEAAHMEKDAWNRAKRKMKEREKSLQNDKKCDTQKQAKKTLTQVLAAPPIFYRKMRCAYFLAESTILGVICSRNDENVVFQKLELP